MKQLSYFLIAACAVLVASCSSGNEAGSLDQREIQSLEIVESTRLVFNDFDALREHLATVKDDDQFAVDLRSSLSDEGKPESEESIGRAIVSKYLAYTSMGKIFNSENEFQVGDTIIKLGDDGYTIYKIHVNSYKAANPYFVSNVTKSLDKFRKVSDCFYELEKGIILWYSGDPLIETVALKSEPILDWGHLNYFSKEAETIDLRSGGCGPVVKFWRSSNFFFVGCGIEMEYSEMQSGKCKAKNTNLRMCWDFVVIGLTYDNYPNGTQRIANGIKIDTGSSDKKTFAEIVGVNLGKYKYHFVDGRIIGEAQHSNGQWLNDTKFWYDYY
jgi:hypothetical protein